MNVAWSPTPQVGSLISTSQCETLVAWATGLIGYCCGITTATRVGNLTVPEPITNIHASLGL